MPIIIHKHSKLSEIQDAFNSSFPSLKLNFFEFKKGKEKIFSKNHLIKVTHQTIGDFNKAQKTISISTNGNQKVSTFENNFNENSDVQVQVFRKSGKNWIETSSSDNLTLSKLNSIGLESSLSNEKVLPPDFDDYHEQS